MPDLQLRWHLKPSAARPSSAAASVLGAWNAEQLQACLDAVSGAPPPGLLSAPAAASRLLPGAPELDASTHCIHGAKCPAAPTARSSPAVLTAAGLRWYPPVCTDLPGQGHISSQRVLILCMPVRIAQLTRSTSSAPPILSEACMEPTLTDHLKITADYCRCHAGILTGLLGCTMRQGTLQTFDLCVFW